jgi:hypothetical protein
MTDHLANDFAAILSQSVWVAFKMGRPRETAATGYPTRQYHSATLRLGWQIVSQAAPGMSSCANATNDLNRAELFKTGVSPDDSNAIRGQNQSSFMRACRPATKM